MTRFWFETALGAAETALALRIVWLVLRIRRWQKRRAAQDRDYQADYLWYLFRDSEAEKAKRLYEKRVGYPADTARLILSEDSL